MRPCPACTIVSNNYLAAAKVFAESYRATHHDAEIFVCVVDRADPQVAYHELPFKVVFAHELGVPRFGSFAFRYEILELNTAVKPYFLTYLRDRLHLDRVLYFDPDILVLSDLTPLGALLDEHPVLLTPHITSPLEGPGRPTDHSLLMCGVYNLGFVGFRLDDQTAPFLAWWREKLYTECLRDIHQGLFVDQRWMDFAPAFLEGAKVVRDPAYNVAYWNLAHRHPCQRDGRWEVDGRPLGFFHFSGLDLEDLESISRFQTRFRLSLLPELRPLLEEYRARMLAAGHEQYSGLPYGYASFSHADLPIPRVARKLLRQEDPTGRRWPDPFDGASSDSFLQWLVEPTEVRNGTLNRVVEALWTHEPDLVRGLGFDSKQELRRLHRWLTVEGGAALAGLHPTFVSGIGEHAAGSGGSRRRREPQAPRPVPSLYLDDALLTIDKIPLSNPGPLTAWLNQRIAWTARRKPTITRIALLVYQARVDVQAIFPDPLGRDQAEYALWFVRFGAPEMGLHPSLVRPVRRTLRA
jgi:hypothetical protein